MSVHIESYHTYAQGHHSHTGESKKRQINTTKKESVQKAVNVQKVCHK